MRRKFTLLPAAALLSVPLLLGNVSIARSDSTDASQGSAEPRHLDRLKTKLGLNDDQVATIRAAFESNREARNDLRARLKTAMADLRKAAIDGGDARTLQQKTDAVTALYSQMLSMRNDELKTIGAALTPEQRTAFAQMNGHGRRGRHGHHGGHRSHGEAPADSTVEG
jgi:Spy/CpxP family protein refolding chaperone